tara:strand:- start:120 stop:374 length:255 start_codon:yes stop_codon:yes gene_type:complete
MMRYSEFCQKTGTTPQWSNVYNTVNVEITNEEFGSVTTKDVETAKYLDMLENVKVTNAVNIDETYSFEKIMIAGGVSVESTVNN